MRKIIPIYLFTPSTRIDEDISVRYNINKCAVAPICVCAGTNRQAELAAAPKARADRR